jgi:hypothetical protein
MSNFCGHTFYFVFKEKIQDEFSAAMLTSWCNENAIMSIFINYDT